MKNKSKYLLHRILYYAMIDIREDAYEAKHKASYMISDLLHNLPLQLLNAKNENDYQKLMEELEKKASNVGMIGWINKLIEMAEDSQAYDDFKESDPKG